MHQGQPFLVQQHLIAGGSLHMRLIHIYTVDDDGTLLYTISITELIFFLRLGHCDLIEGLQIFKAFGEVSAERHQQGRIRLL